MLGGLAWPQLLVRLGWQEMTRDDLPRTPRRPVEEVLRFDDWQARSVAHDVPVRPAGVVVRRLGVRRRAAPRAGRRPRRRRRTRSPRAATTAAARRCRRAGRRCCRRSELTCTYAASAAGGEHASAAPRPRRRAPARTAPAAAAGARGRGARRSRRPAAPRPTGQRATCQARHGAVGPAVAGDHRVGERPAGHQQQEADARPVPARIAVSTAARPYFATARPVAADAVDPVAPRSTWAIAVVIESSAKAQAEAERELAGLARCCPGPVDRAGEGVAAAAAGGDRLDRLGDHLGGPLLVEVGGQPGQREQERHHRQARPAGPAPGCW